MVKYPDLPWVQVVPCGRCRYAREPDEEDIFERTLVEGVLWCDHGRSDCGVWHDQYCDDGELKEDEGKEGWQSDFWSLADES